MSMNHGGKFKRVAIAIAIAAAVAGAQACSSQSSNQPSPPVTAASAPAPQAQPLAQTHSQDDQPDSVLGAGAHFVWTVVAFPFRVVGDVLGLLV
jgi:hypothetical protein